MRPIRFLGGVALSLIAVTAHAQGASEGFVTMSDGVRIFYQKAGTSPRTLIVPGRLFVWKEFQSLGDAFTVISYDMRGRGQSDLVRDTTRISIQQDVEDLEAIRRHFGAQRVSVAGYSYLGLMVLLYAAAHPDAVDRIVQIGSVPRIWNTPFPDSLRGPTGPTGADSVDIKRLADLEARGAAAADPRAHCEARWRVTRFGLVGNPANVGVLGESPCDMPNEWHNNFLRQLRYHFGSVQRLDIPWSHFARVTHPVLTIHGTLDRNAPYGGAIEWASHLANARLLTVRGGAHQVFAEYPNVVFPAIRTFLGGAWPQGATTVRR